MSKRNLEKMKADNQNMEEYPEKLSRSDAAACPSTPTAINQLPTDSRQSTFDQESIGKAQTAALSSLQVQTIKICPAKLSSVPENEYGKNGFPRIAVGQKVGGKFDTLKFLGFGKYATIWLVKNSVDGKYEAWKITKSDPHYQEKAKGEAQFMEYMVEMGTHKNIVKFLGITEIREKGAIHHALRFEMLGPNLNEVLHQSELKFHPDVLRNMIKQLLKAVEYVHHRGIIQMDIKPENMILHISNNIYHLDLTRANSKSTLKLADFGMAFRTGVGLSDVFPYYQTEHSGKRRKMATGAVQNRVAEVAKTLPP
uniref:Protein kinase domain-containing protein n=1 Tax=Caenorhabditis tropicalis TaxID=1561998 RepID=A0A1I7U2Y2_9PELO